MKIIKNCISIQEQENIKNLLIGKTKIFPWYFREDITNSSLENNQKRCAFGHYFFIDRKITSAFKYILDPIINKNIKEEIIQCRSFLQVPLNQKLIGNKIDRPHIDLNEKHKVYLYYVSTSDGETVFFKKNKIIKKIKPEQGKLVIFSGDIYHSAKQPKKNIRCIINFDVKND